MPPTANHTIYTIGHSTHEIDYFVELLTTHGINCVVDVRSVAASAYNPQYNQLPLAAYLKIYDIFYMHFEEEFGARQVEPEVLDRQGQVDFEKVQQTDTFQKGVQRLQKGLDKGFRIALMCSESNPLECHRFSMVAVDLARQGFNLLHILKDKTLLTQTELEAQLMDKYAKKLPVPDLFNPNVTEEDRLKAAYRCCNREIGYKTY